METYLRVKKWEEFQHYKRRNPPWIRLYRRIVDDADFQSLPIASRALAPMLWLMASETMDGKIHLKLTALSFRLRRTIDEVLDGLIPLINQGFVEGHGDFASEVLAQCKRGATPESEAETEKSQKHVRQMPSDVSLPDDFQNFWVKYPKHEAKKKALAAWHRLTMQDRLAALAGIDRWKETPRWKDPQFIMLASTYLNERRWEDEVSKAQTLTVEQGIDAKFDRVIAKHAERVVPSERQERPQ